MAITIITGPPGAGKTTIARRLAYSRELGVHLIADQVFHWIVSGYIQPWRRGSERQNATAIRTIAAAARQFADESYEVFVDGIIGPWFLSEWLDVDRGPQLPNYVILRPSRSVARERALGRTRRGALTEPEPVSAMFDVFEHLGAFEAYVLDSSTFDVAQTAADIEEYLDLGRFQLAGELVPEMKRIATYLGIEEDDPAPEPGSDGS